jgi:hypothetical protein
MKKVLFSIIAVGVLGFGFFGTASTHSNLFAQGAETNGGGHPIQPPV